MNYVNRLFYAFFLIGALTGTMNVSASTMQQQDVSAPKPEVFEPSFARKAFSTIAAPAATYGTIVGFGFGLNKLAQYMPVIGNGTMFAGARPYFAGLAAALAWYNFATPMQQYYYTCFSGDTDRLEKSIQSITCNEATIKSILKEILLVKKHLVVNYKPWISHQVMTDFLGDACWQKLTAILSGGSDASDQLPMLKVLAGFTGGNSNDHWYSLGFVKAFINAKNAVMRPFEVVSQNNKIGSWEFDNDPRLLVTWGGSSIETAAKNIVFVFNGGDLTLENAQKFQNNAKIIINYAEQVLGQLKEYKNSIKRVKDLASVSQKTVSAVGSTASAVGNGVATVVNAIERLDDEIYADAQQDAKAHAKSDSIFSINPEAMLSGAVALAYADSGFPIDE